MKGLLEPEKVAALPAVAAWLAHAESTRRIVKENYGNLAGARLLTATVEENVLVQLENLRTLPSVASRLVRGDLHLHGWVYRIESGEVFAYDLASGQFVPLAEYKIPSTKARSRRRVSTDI
jgi:carbonic anhydrase